MKTRPIRPARIDIGPAADAPLRPMDGDRQAPPGADALARARQVFLQGNRLPERWAGRTRFVVLATGFGAGHAFLATWQAWRDDPAHCERLVFVAIEGCPLRQTDLARIHAHIDGPLRERADALVAAWPPLTANLHALDFEQGRVQLLLALGDVALLLPALQVQADACFLDAGWPESQPASADRRVIKALARKAAPGASLASPSVGQALRDSLQACGYAVDQADGADGQARMTVAQHAPAYAARGPAAHGPARAPRTALVIGAGVAGAAAAQGLLRQGLQVTVLDRLPAPAGAASGNPAALVHGTVHPDDGPYARLFRACALEAQRCYRQAAETEPGIAAMDGLLRMHEDAAAATLMGHALARQQLPPGYVQALDATAARERSGLAPHGPGLPAGYYTGGGWVQPAAWVRQVLSQPGVQFRGDRAVTRIAQHHGAWCAFDAAGMRLAEADVLVLACTAQSAALLRPWLPEGWPLSATQGQVTQGRLPAGQPPLRLPMAGDGYAIPMPGGGVLCGATRHAVPVSDIDQPVPVRDADHGVNLERLQRLTGLTLEGPLQGRGAWRLHSDDRLPIAGAVPASELRPGARRDQARFLPRVPGLFVLTALGARGLTLAPLLGRLVAAQATGAPWPLEQDLADAIDPARWQVRAARRAGPPRVTEAD